MIKGRLKNILVTGGAGFIGSNFIHYVFKNTSFCGKIINVDKLTYAGNLENLVEIENKYRGERYFFERVDICDFDEIKKIFKKYDIDIVVNFAAESHVDRSIYGPKDFMQTNIMGTFNLLEVARKYWEEKDSEETLFHHISTDEVYGSVEEGNYFYENTPYRPNNPYSASKASSDHLMRSYHKTYGLPATISNCSNNYGSYQFPEKLIPLMIFNILEENPLPVYGDGRNVRDWLYVKDHCSAIWEILNRGEVGETYNIGGENEWENIKLINVLCEMIGEIKGKNRDYYKRLIINVLCEMIGEIKGKNRDYYKRLIIFIKDRPGHDRRYAINCDKIKKELGWQRKFDFKRGLDATIKWYINNQDWMDRVRSGEYRKWLEKNYKVR